MPPDTENGEGQQGRGETVGGGDDDSETEPSAVSSDIAPSCRFEGGGGFAPCSLRPPAKAYLTISHINIGKKVTRPATLTDVGLGIGLHPLVLPLYLPLGSSNGAHCGPQPNPTLTHLASSLTVH